MNVIAAPEDAPWMWTVAYGRHEDRTPTPGYEATREAAFAKSWRREYTSCRELRCSWALSCLSYYPPPRTWSAIGVPSRSMKEFLKFPQSASELSSPSRAILRR